MGPQFMYIYGVPSQSVVTFRFTGRTSYAIDWGLWCDSDAGTHFHDFTPECVSLSSHIAQPTNSWYSTNHDKKGFFKTSSKCYIIMHVHVELAWCFDCLLAWFYHDPTRSDVRISSLLSCVQKWVYFCLLIQRCDSLLSGFSPV